MADRISIGDGVVLNCDVLLSEMAGEANHWLATPRTSSKAKPPFRILDCVMGIYMGPHRIAQQDRRTASKTSLRLYHRFMFGGAFILIDPSIVTVAAPFSKVV